MYASVIGTQVSPTAVTGRPELPSAVTASGESSNYLSESAFLESKVAKLIAQLDSSIDCGDGLSDPSSPTASTPDIDLGGSAVQSPPQILHNTQAMAHTPPSYDLPTPPKQSGQSALINTEHSTRTGVARQ
jgi:hypothetical protein